MFIKNSIIFFLLFFISLIILIGNMNPDPSKNNLIIGVNTIEYQKYLNQNPPLDRLYRKGNIYYFIISKKEYKELLDFGINPVHTRLIPEETNMSKLSETSNDYNGDYHNYKESNALLNDLQVKYPGNARVFSIGKSIEGRDLNIIHISSNLNTIINKQNIFIVGCHHAREWISVEVPLLFAKYLLENQNNSDVQKALEANIYILPILNPDGLEFSIHKYRYWRKNRKYNGDFSWGVDLNRNYGYMWGFDDLGSSSYPDSEVYRGTNPFSEPETEALRQFLLANPPDGSLSFHNYSQLILMPWGYKYEKPEDFEEMETIASEMSKKIFNVNGRQYDYGGAEALYLVNGSTDDWIYGTFKIPSFTIELPPPNVLEGGFFTSEEEISLSFNENLPAMLYFINYFVNKNKKDKEEIIIEKDILEKEIKLKIPK